MIWDGLPVESVFNSHFLCWLILASWAGVKRSSQKREPKMKISECEDFSIETFYFFSSKKHSFFLPGDVINQWLFNPLLINESKTTCRRLLKILDTVAANISAWIRYKSSNIAVKQQQNTGIKSQKKFNCGLL